MPLPDGADEDDITATYDRGILTVSVPLSDAEPTEKHVEVYEIAPLDEDVTTTLDERRGRRRRPSKPTVDRSQAEDQPQHDQGA